MYRKKRGTCICTLGLCDNGKIVSLYLLIRYLAIVYYLCRYVMISKITYGAEDGDIDQKQQLYVAIKLMQPKSLISS